MNSELIRKGEELFEVIRKISAHTVEDKDKVVDKELLGKWVKFHDCDHVLLQNGSYLICRTVQDAEIMETLLDEE